MRTVRVYDATRRPRDWSELIEPGQYVVFASILDGGAPCDPNGVPTGNEAATCILVDALAEAETFCAEQVDHHPDVRFDIFDAAARSRPPLLTVVHPTRVRTLEGDASLRRRNLTIAMSLVGAAPVLFWLDWHVGLMGLPTLLGLNGLVFAGRVLQLNSAYTSAERRRRERVDGGAAPR